MNVVPLKFRETVPGKLLFADDAGSYFRSDAKFLDRYACGRLNRSDMDFLTSNGHAFHDQHDLDFISFAYRYSLRQATANELSYLIVVPTLRCNLACSYCQVSRAAEHARGYDWTPEILDAFVAYLNGLSTPHIKIEFQGGEPLLRLDLLDRVRAFARSRFAKAEFVVCTNLQSVSDEAWQFLDAADTFVSTSLDGDATTHERQRTHSREATQAFFENLGKAAEQLGPRRISALPTIDPEAPPPFEQLIAQFETYGLTSIFLRPISFHGFARKREPASPQKWNALHRAFIEFLIDRNFATKRCLEEYYFSLCLKRVLQPYQNGHVDLRNPAPLGADYLVVDHDGRLFPTDEARMLYRVGHADLSVGDIKRGIDRAAVKTLSDASLNNFDPDCIHCPYQAFCGTDIVDDIARQNRVDVPKPTTWFCARHTALFDLVFELLYRNDAKTRYSLAAWAGVADWPPELAPVHA